MKNSMFRERSVFSFAVLMFFLISVGTVALAMNHSASGMIDSNVQPRDEKSIALQTKCPVMGGPINKELYVDYRDQRIFVCCAGCIPAVEKNPEKYIRVIRDRGEQVAQLQTSCPVMGGGVNKSLFADYQGKRVYVCCPGCIKMIQDDPEKYMKKMEEQGIVLEDTPVVDSEKSSEEPSEKKSDK